MNEITAGLRQVMHEKSIERFRYRRANPPKLVIDGIPIKSDNAALPAGMPMVYFCEFCGWPTAILDEQFFLCAVPHWCLECEGLMRMGWLQEAKSEA